MPRLLRRKISPRSRHGQLSGGTGPEGLYTTKILFFNPGSGERAKSKHVTPYYQHFTRVGSTRLTLLTLLETIIRDQKVSRKYVRTDSKGSARVSRASRAEYMLLPFILFTLFTRHTVINDQTSRARVTPERAR